MRHLKKGFTMIMGVILIAGLVGIAVPKAEAAKYVMKFAHNSPPKPSMLYTATATTFQNYLRIYTDGEADIQIFPSSQLGKDSIAAKKVQLGSVHLQTVVTNNISRFDRRIDVYTLPFLFKSFKSAAKVLNSDIGKNIAENYRKKSGIRILSSWPCAFRKMANSKHPILKPSDLGGLRMRIAKNPIMVDTYKAFGGSTIGMAPTEVFSALAQKVVDGQDGGTAWQWSMKFYEVQKYMSVTNHQLAVCVIIINDKYFNGLPKEIQEGVQKAATASTDWLTGYSEAFDEGLIAKFAAKGLKIDRPDLKPFVDAVKPVYKKFAKKLGGIELINKIIDMQK